MGSWNDPVSFECRDRMPLLGHPAGVDADVEKARCGVDLEASRFARFIAVSGRGRARGEVET